MKNIDLRNTTYLTKTAKFRTETRGSIIADNHSSALQHLTNLNAIYVAVSLAGVWKTPKHCEIIQISHLKASKHYHKHAQQSHITPNVMATTCQNSNDRLTAKLLANQRRQNPKRARIKPVIGYKFTRILVFCLHRPLRKYWSVYSHSMI